MSFFVFVCLFWFCECFKTPSLLDLNFFLQQPIPVHIFRLFFQYFGTIAPFGIFESHMFVTVFCHFGLY